MPHVNCVLDADKNKLKPFNAAMDLLVYESAFGKCTTLHDGAEQLLDEMSNTFLYKVFNKRLSLLDNVTISDGVTLAMIESTRSPAQAVLWAITIHRISVMTNTSHITGAEFLQFMSDGYPDEKEFDRIYDNQKGSVLGLAHDNCMDNAELWLNAPFVFNENTYNSRLVRVNLSNNVVFVLNDKLLLEVPHGDYKPRMLTDALELSKGVVRQAVSLDIINTDASNMAEVYFNGALIFKEQIYSDTSNKDLSLKIYAKFVEFQKEQ